MSDIINPVLQEWVMTLKWKDQTGLISAIRGVDMIGVEPTDIEVSSKCKSITKMIRFLVLNNADSRTNFMTDKVIMIDILVDNLSYLHKQVSLGILSNHWFDHILLAIKNIRAFHPNPYTRMYWDTVYTKYNTTPLPTVERVVLEKNDITDDNITELKDILTVIDSGNIVVEESTNISSDTNNNRVGGHDIHILQVERVITNIDVSYDYTYTSKSDQKQFKDMLEVLPQLDAIVTKNWDVIIGTRSADYNLPIPVSKNIDNIRVKDTNTNSFMVANLTGELLYKDHLDVVWVIHSNLLLCVDKLRISIIRWLGNIDTVVYLLNINKLHSKEDTYIHGEIR